MPTQLDAQTHAVAHRHGYFKSVMKGLRLACALPFACCCAASWLPDPSRGTSCISLNKSVTGIRAWSASDELAPFASP